MKYLFSLLKYILLIVLLTALMACLKLAFPVKMEMTYNQAIIFLIVLIISIGVGLKTLFDKK